MPTILRGGAAPSRALAMALGALLALTGLTGCGRAPVLTGCGPAGGLHPACGFQNPEDLAALPAGPLGGWLLVSQMARRDSREAGAGSLLAYRPADGARRVLYPRPGEASGAGRAPDGAHAGDPTCPGPPPPASFAPHGIDVVPGPGGAHLLAVNHGGREAIEIFAIREEAGAPTLAWQGCVPLPKEAQANDVAGLPDGSFYATNFIPRHQTPLTALRLLVGASTGDVLSWGPGRGWSIVPESRSSAPNGIAVSGDGRTLYVNEWGDEALMRMDASGGGIRRVRLGFHPDNITWAPDGRLVVAGQRASLWTMMRCRGVVTGTCGLPFRVVAVDPTRLAVTVLVDGANPQAIGAVSVGLEEGSRLWLGTFAGDRLAWREQP